MYAAPNLFWSISAKIHSEFSTYFQFLIQNFLKAAFGCSKCFKFERAQCDDLSYQVF